MSMIPDKLNKEKVWEIASIVIYDEDANELVRRDYLGTNLDFSTELISNFAKTLENFSQNQFKEKVYEIHLGSYRILFEEIAGFILTAIVLPGNAVDTGKASPMSRAVRNLLQRVGEVLNLDQPDVLRFKHIDTGFIDKMVDTINSTSDNPDSVFHNIQNFENSGEFFVTAVLITDDTGNPYVSRTYEDGVYNEDPLLISSLISAISHFAQQISKLEFKEIVLGRYRVYLKNVEDRIYVTTIEFPSDQVVFNHNSEVHKYVEKLNNSLVESTSFLDGTESTSESISINHHTLTAVVDALVIKSIQRTIGEKSIDRENIKDVNLYDQKSAQRASGQEKRITDEKEYENAKGIFSRIRNFFRSN